MSHIECPKCRTRNHTSQYGLSSPIGGMAQWTRCDDCGLLMELRPDTDGLPQSGVRQAKSLAFAALAPYRKAAGILPQQRDKVRRQPTWRQRVDRAAGFRSWCQRHSVSLAQLLKADPTFDRKRWKP